VKLFGFAGVFMCVDELCVQFPINKTMNSIKSLIVCGICTAMATGVVMGEEERADSERKRPPFKEGREEGDREDWRKRGGNGKPPFEGRRDMFTFLDRDEDGKISKREFFASPRMEMLPEEKRERFFARLDGDKDGFLSREELDLLKKDAEERAEKVRREFRDLDKDGSGGLSFAEFSEGEFMKKLPEEKRREIFKRMDTDGNGEINAEDRPKGPRPPMKKVD
jgi:Ca2+-binding EF-hand superfamily protein